MRRLNHGIFLIISALISAVFEFFVVAALIGSLGFKPFRDWFDPVLLNQAKAAFTQWQISQGIRTFWESATLGGIALYLFLFLLSLPLLRLLIKSKKEPAKSPAPLMEIDGVPFKKLKVGTLEELVGRGDELDWLKKRLIDEPSLCVVVTSIHGAGGMGKTFLAQKFAADNLRDLKFVEIYIGERSAYEAGIDFLQKLGIDASLIGSVDDFTKTYKKLFGEGSGVLILDDVWNDDIALLQPENRNWRTLITTRNAALGRILSGENNTLPIDALDPDHALELFQKVLGEAFEDGWRNDYLNLAECLGRRPYGIRLAAASLKAKVSKDESKPAVLLAAIKEQGLPDDDLRPLLIHSLSQLTDISSYARDLLDYIAVCSDEGIELRFFLQWHKEIASEDQLQHELARAQDLGLLLVEIVSVNRSEAETGEKRIRLHSDMLSLIRESELNQARESLRDYLFCTLIDPGTFSEDLRPLHRQIAALYENPAEDKNTLLGLYNSFHKHLWSTGQLQWAHELADRLIAHTNEEEAPELFQRLLGNQALILRGWGKPEEAMALHKKEEAICSELGDQGGLASCYGNQALILRGWGKPEEAMALHKKEEAIFSELGDQGGLSRCYGNQALILRGWGKPEEAMALHKKEEAICSELGDQGGLSRCYGNQALILRGWGKPEEAMALFKKQEAICSELGDQGGLARCYGNQALILMGWGKPEEAMALFKKQEAICSELGDQGGLASCYGNQALILRGWGKPEEAMALHKKEEAICSELGDQGGLSRCYGNQALILRGWGKPEEAMALFKKQEAICSELGDQGGLSRCYGNQALILMGWGKPEEAMALFKKQEAICSELGDQGGLATCLWNKGLLLREGEKHSEAIEKLKCAIEINEKIGRPDLAKHKDYLKTYQETLELNSE